MRIVLDTSALVTAFRNPAGASGEILRLALRRKVTLLASVALYLEYEAVLTRAEHLSVAKMTSDDAVAALDAMASFIEPVETYFLWRPRLRDADDDMVLEAAVNGAAEFIVTFNLRDFAVAGQEFGIAALLPADFLRRM